MKKQPDITVRFKDMHSTRIFLSAIFAHSVLDPHSLCADADPDLNPDLK
jgi:hypothetical protein